MCSGDLPEDVRRHGLVDVDVCLDVSGGCRDPRAQDHGIDEDDTPRRRLLDQVGPYDRGAPDVVSDKSRRVQAPCGHEFRQNLSVYGDGHVLLLVPFRVAEPQEVEDVDRVVHGKPWGDVAPEHRSTRCAVHEHDRGSFAQDVPGDLTMRRLDSAPERPSGGRGHERVNPLASISRNS